MKLILKESGINSITKDFQRILEIVNVGLLLI